ncbi:MAG TPA: pyridoxal-dependent decarboxylase [Rhodospirillaceae bacterium]|nr:pyridoxal-dependent decarboxylase [Rhodospirillaceae bacterium]
MAVVANLRQAQATDIVRLRPLIHDTVQDFLDTPELVHQLVQGFGSPLNIIFPDHIAENLKSFQDVYRKYSLKGRIYFTSKPCKSKAIIRKASLYDIGIDVSSSESLNHVMAAGFSPERIEATGPKNNDYILKCLQLDILINVDNIAELQSIQKIRHQLGLLRKARVMIRLTGFSSPRMHFTPQDGTFGIHTKEIPALIDWLVARRDEIDFKGFSFHLTDMNEQQKLVAIENAAQLIFHAIQKGLQPKAMNIGGGYPIQYAKDTNEYDEYIEQIKKSVIGKIENQVWNDGGLGYKDHHGVVVGGPLFMNHAPPHTKGGMLDHLLSQRSPVFGNVTYADLIRDNLLELYIEPGRAMLDQCGITLARVTHTKNSTNGELLIGLDMNRSNNHSQNIKNLCEPVLIPRCTGRQAIPLQTRGFYYVGHLCLSYDIIQYNKIYSDQIPQAGDVVAFINTAPYIMDFTESETLMHPVAEKVAVWKENNQFKWATDQKYLPINIYDEAENDCQ